MKEKFHRRKYFSSWFQELELLPKKLLHTLNKLKKEVLKRFLFLIDFDLHISNNQKKRRKNTKLIARLRCHKNVFLYKKVQNRVHIYLNRNEIKYKKKFNILQERDNISSIKSCRRHLILPIKTKQSISHHIKV